MNKRHELIKLLSEIRKVRNVAISMDDVSMNSAIEEMDRLAVECLRLLEK